MGVFSCNSKSSGIGSLGFWLFRQDHKITDKLRDYMRVPGTRGEERGGKMSKKMRDSRASVFTFRKHFGSFPLNDYHWHLSGQVCAMWQGNLGNICYSCLFFIFFSLTVCHPQKTNWCFINKDEGENESALGNWLSQPPVAEGRQRSQGYVWSSCPCHCSLPASRETWEPIRWRPV